MPWRMAACEDRLVALDGEGAAARLDGDGEASWERGAASVNSALRLNRGPRLCPRSTARLDALPARFRRPTPADRRLRRRRPARRCGCCAGRWRVLALTSTPGTRRRRCAPPALVPLRRRPRPAGDARPPRRPGRRGAAPRAAAGRRRDRPAHRAPAARAGAQRPRAPPRLRQHQRRLRRLRRRALRRDARRCAGHRPRPPPRRCRGAAALLRPRRRRRASRVLRIPGIYARRPRRRPPARAAARAARRCCAADDDVYTNHIHADDLARACVAALRRGRPQRVVHASDDSELKMGDYFDLAADLLRPAAAAAHRARRGRGACCRRCR